MSVKEKCLNMLLFIFSRDFRSLLMYQFSFHTGAIPTPTGLNNVRRDLCCFLLPHFPGGTVLLKGFSVQCLRCPAAIPLPQGLFATRTCLAHPSPSLPHCVWAQRKRGYLFFSPLNCILPFFFLWKLLIKEPEQGNIPVQGPLTADQFAWASPF